MQSDKLNLKDIVEILLKVTGYYMTFSSGVGLIYYIISLATIVNHPDFYMQGSGQLIFSLSIGLCLIFYSKKASAFIVGDKFDKSSNPIEIEKSILLIGLVFLFLSSLEDVFRQIFIYYSVDPAFKMAQKHAEIESAMTGEPIQAISHVKSSLGIIFSLLKTIIYSFLLYQAKEILSFFFDKTKSPSRPLNR